MTTGKQPKDNFSGQAKTYALHRPQYPPELYAFVLSTVPSREHVWDCATGNGQAAVVLANYFKSVEATDISSQQLAEAPSKPNIQYQVATAENTPFESDTFDLITVAQAYHWLDHTLFLQEAQRVLKPDGILAVWGYNLPRIDDTIDPLLQHFYQNIVGPYWDPERKLVDQQYSSLSFDWQTIQCPDFAFVTSKNLEAFGGYLQSWSAVQKFIKKEGKNPVLPFIESLKRHWPPQTVKNLYFPIFMRLGRY